MTCRGEISILKGQDRDQLEVKGKWIDIIKLAMLPRKKVGRASIVCVAMFKKEEKREGR